MSTKIINPQFWLPEESKSKKEEYREELKRHMREFLAKGGKIQVLPNIPVTPQSLKEQQN